MSAGQLESHVKTSSASTQMFYLNLNVCFLELKLVLNLNLNLSLTSNYTNFTNLQALRTSSLSHSPSPSAMFYYDSLCSFMFSERDLSLDL